jgi:beta-xylosidase
MIISLNRNNVFFEKISEKKFNSKLKEMREAVLKTSGGKHPISLREWHTVHGNVAHTHYEFTSGDGYIELWSQVCDEGYCFVE